MLHREIGRICRDSRGKRSPFRRVMRRLKGRGGRCRDAPSNPLSGDVCSTMLSQKRQRAARRLQGQPTRNEQRLARLQNDVEQREKRRNDLQVREQEGREGQVNIVQHTLALGSSCAKRAVLLPSEQSGRRAEARAAIAIQAWWRSIQLQCREIISTLSEIAANTNQNPMQLAVELGNLSVMNYLCCQTGVNVQMCDTSSVCSLLHIAAKHGHLDIAMYLCSRRANLNARDDRGATPLHHAVAFGHFDVVQYLCDEGADMNAHDFEDATPFVAAYSRAFLPVVKYWYLWGKVEDATAWSKDGSTPWHWASRGGYQEDVKCLRVELEDDLETQDSHGWTPLHQAAWLGRRDLVEYFCADLCANVIARTREGATPLHFAAARGHLGVVEYLCDSGSIACEIRDETLGATPLHYAAFGGHLNFLEYVEVAPPHQGHIEVVKYLCGEVAVDVMARTERQIYAVASCS